MGHDHDRVRMEVQGEVERRQNLATQLRNLLESQLEVGTDTHQPLSEVALLVPATEEISLYLCFRDGIVYILVVTSGYLRFCHLLWSHTIMPTLTLDPNKAFDLFV